MPGPVCGAGGGACSTVSPAGRASARHGRAAASAAAIVSSTRLREIIDYLRRSVLSVLSVARVIRGSLLSAARVIRGLQRLQELDERALVGVRKLGAEHVAAIEHEVRRLIAPDEPAE